MWPPVPTLFRSRSSLGARLTEHPKDYGHDLRFALFCCHLYRHMLCMSYDKHKICRCKWQQRRWFSHHTTQFVSNTYTHRLKTTGVCFYSWGGFLLPQKPSTHTKLSSKLTSTYANPNLTPSCKKAYRNLEIILNTIKILERNIVKKYSHQHIS